MLSKFEKDLDPLNEISICIFIVNLLDFGYEEQKNVVYRFLTKNK